MSSPRPRFVALGRALLNSGTVGTDRSKGFSWIQGDGVVLSAPHAVAHMREGRAKKSEGFTELLAVTLAHEVGGSAIWVTETLSGDPNWDLEHPYKDKVYELANGHPVIDLHVMKNRGFEVCIGLGQMDLARKELWSDAADAFLSAGMTVAINYPFSAGLQTVTGAIQARGLSALQIEFTWDSISSPGRADKTWNALLKFCISLRQ